jgi:hypothetical protein
MPHERRRLLRPDARKRASTLPGNSYGMHTSRLAGTVSDHLGPRALKLSRASPQARFCSLSPEG